MTIQTASQYRDEFLATFVPDGNTTAQSLVSNIMDQATAYHMDRPFDANSNSTSVHTMDMSTTVQLRVKNFRWGVRANVTADNTNNCTINLVYNNGNGGADTVIATANTAQANGGGTGSITLETPFNFTINSTNAVVPVGSQLQIKVTKSGSGGLLLPASTFEVKASVV